MRLNANALMPGFGQCTYQTQHDYWDYANSTIMYMI